MSAKALTTVVESSQIDLAIMAWLDAKKRHSGSKKTHKAYSDTLLDFRTLLQQAGRDLDPYLNVIGNSEEARRRAFSEIGLVAQGFAGQSVAGKRKVAESTASSKRRAAVITQGIQPILPRFSSLGTTPRLIVEFLTNYQMSSTPWTRATLFHGQPGGLRWPRV